MGRVQKALEARANRVEPEMNRLRGDAMKVLVQGLRESVEEQPYSRSPHRARLTRRLFRSIRPRALGNQGAGVGFDTSIAPHAEHRLKMTGPYRKTKSGNKAMTPAADVERLKGEELRRLAFQALKRITD